MFYTYSRKNLEFKRFGFKHYSILALTLFLTYTVGRFIQVNHLTLYEKEFIVYMDQNYFSQDALIDTGTQATFSGGHKQLKSRRISRSYVNWFSVNWGGFRWFLP